MKLRKKHYADDDERVIANMNVEGMQWYNKSIRQKIFNRYYNTYLPELTRSEARQYTWYSFLAALIIVSVFSTTWVLFTLFCIYVWFR